MQIRCRNMGLLGASGVVLFDFDAHTAKSTLGSKI
jgi:hypothetical protein